jgi:hypothetical protein
MDQIAQIQEDISLKMAEVRLGSDAHRLLVIKQKLIDDSVQRIIRDAQVNRYEYELYLLADKSEILRDKIHAKERRPSIDDEDMKALREVTDQMAWIRETKLKGFKHTDIQKPLLQTTGRVYN